MCVMDVQRKSFIQKYKETQCIKKLLSMRNHCIYIKHSVKIIPHSECITDVHLF